VDDKIPSPTFGFLVLAATILLGLLVANTRRSSLGQRMLAVRSNERAAAAAGINVRNTKLAGFGIAAFIAGMAGALYAYNFGSVSYSRFGALSALGLIAFGYFGGITMVSGAVVAGIGATEGLFPHAFDRFFGLSGNWALLVGGFALIITLIVNPEGIAGMAGALYAYNFGSVSYSRFGALAALGLIAFGYFGGITMVSGAVVSVINTTEGLFPHAFDRFLGLSGNWALLVGGFALIITLIVNPEGIAGTGWKKKQQKKKKKRRASGPAPTRRCMPRLSRAAGKEAP